MSPPDERPSRGPAFWLATFFGAGLLPKAPGTWGSLASLAIWAPLVLFSVPEWLRVLLAVVVFLIGIPASTRAAAVLGKDDPKEVVIDEVAGQGLALALAAPSVASIVLGFALFRLFDVKKPWLVGWADRELHGGLGIMADDMIAGALALVVLTAFERWAVPALGIPWP